MQTVIFLVYHGMGHFNACFRIAKILQQNYNVVFAGAGFFRDYMESQGFMYYPLKTVPFGMGFEAWVNEQNKGKRIYLNSLKDRWRDTLYKSREAEFNQLLHDLSPDYIFIDAYQSTDFIVLYPYLKERSIKVGFIQTMFPTSISENYPPINSLVFPGDQKGIKKAIKKFHFTKFRKKIKQEILYFGMSDEAIISRRIARNGIPREYRSSETALRGVAFSTIPEFVLAPKEFDFEETISTDRRHYIGFMSDPDRIEISDMEYFKIDSIILKKLRDTQGSLLYCSFGSVKTNDTYAVNSFIQKLLETVRNHNCIVIISVNSILQDQNFDNIPENAYFLKAAPQLEILKRADVFISHGGLNSIKESIRAEVPMLIYPIHSDTDTMGNSTRVVYHKLGLRGDLLGDSEEDIGKKLEALINDDTFKENISKLRKIDETYSGKFMEYFKDLSPVK